MKRILLVLTVALVIAAMMAVTVSSAFAQGPRCGRVCAEPRIEHARDLAAAARLQARGHR